MPSHRGVQDRRPNRPRPSAPRTPRTANDLQTTGSRFNLHFTSKKKGKYIHEGKGGEQQLSEPGSYHFTYSTDRGRVGGALAAWRTLAYTMSRIVDQGNVFKVEAQMEIVRYHTQCKFIVHSFL